MRTLRTLATVFCFCGLIASCGSESKNTNPKTATDQKSETLPAVAAIAAEPVVKDTAKIVEATAKEERMAEEADKIALAAKEANESENAADAAAEKKELEREERRKERRAKRRAERKKKEAEKKKAASKSSSDKPVLSFKKTVHKYGRISQGEKIKHNFVFTNTGGSELIITNAKASCGCTQPSFPFMPISPGEEGYIGVVFDSKGRLGRQKPMITITTNADPATYEIYLEGTVDSEEMEEEKKDKETEEGKNN